MKFQPINKEKLVQNVSELASTLCSSSSTYNIKLHSSKEDSESYRGGVCMYTTKLTFVERRLTGAFGTNLKKLHYFYKSLFPEYQRLIEKVQYDDHCAADKVFYRLDTLYIFEWFYLLIEKDIQERLSVNVRDINYPLTTVLNRAHYKNEPRVTIQLSLSNLKDEYFSKEEAKNIEEQVNSKSDELKEIIEARLVNLIYIVNQVITGQQPVLKKEIGLYENKLQLEILSIKKNVYVDKCTLEKYNTDFIPELKEFMDKYIEIDIEKYNNQIQDTNTLKGLSGIYSQMNGSGLFRNITAAKFQRVIYEKAPELFELNDEDPVFEISKNENLHYFGKINKERFDELKIKVGTARQDVYVKSFIKSLSFL